MLVFFFFKQKTAYEMRISDWSSDVCSSDLCSQTNPTSRFSHGSAVERQADDIVSHVGSLLMRSRFLTGVTMVAVLVSAPAPIPLAMAHSRPASEIGRAACRERVCQYV